jgi:3-hydroxybutyryl-CoA dehydrogenase
MNHDNNFFKEDPILVIGNGKLACSVSVCLTQAQEHVILFTESVGECKKRINIHKQEINQWTDWGKGHSVDVTNDWADIPSISLAITINGKGLTFKRNLIKRLEASFSEDTIIAINTDHIPLEKFQKTASMPENILVMNWVEPAHTTFFLELVHNKVTNKEHILWLNRRAKNYWGKDPYTVKDELGVRGRMIAAMIREAFYLVENGYASAEDIDRSCRNDAGTYLPFAGNFRYMDLMGTYVYGVVMEKLNKELSVEKSLPDFFLEIINNEQFGMKSKKGFYFYEPNEIKSWEEKARNYSYEVHDLMEQYPFKDGKYQ